MSIDRSKYAVLDIETYPNYFLILIRRLVDGKVFTYEMQHDDDPPNWDHLARVLRKYKIITFNGLTFDMPIVFLAMAGASIAELKEAASRIIEGGLRFWEVENAFGIKVPKWLDHIDLMEPNPAVRQSLKVLNGRLHGRWMQELPYHHASMLTEEQMDFVRTYCINDLDATELLFNALVDAIELREQVSDMVGQDVRSKSDAQMGQVIIKKRVADATGKKAEKAEFKAGFSFKYKAPACIKFETPQLQEVLRNIQQHTFITDKDGKVDLPKWIADTLIKIGPSTFQMGIGGLHSTESNRGIKATNIHKIVSVDVSSFYPAILLNSSLYPKALGKIFLNVYRAIRDERVAAKKAKDKVKDKTFKIVLNGCFGLLGNRWSVIYAPDLMIAVTLTGQLSLLMLIERAHLAGIEAISANTDGVEFYCPVEFYEGLDGDRIRGGKLKEITEGWERDTGYVLEAVEYIALYNQSVNSYFALKADGGHKRKGPLSNPWSKDPSDFDLRGQMMKSPQMTICSDAALYFLKNGTPIEDTIRNCKDVRQFITVMTATGGATWRDEYLGKVVRYYWSTDGDAIFKVKAHAKTGNRPKVSKTDGSKPIMELPDDLLVPADVDYDRYIRETHKILEEIGYYGLHRVQQKVDHPLIRLLRR